MFWKIIIFLFWLDILLFLVLTFGIISYIMQDMKYRYKVKEEGTDKEETMEAMSLHKLIKKLDPKKTFRVEYENKKSHDCTKLVFNGTYKII